MTANWQQVAQAALQGAESGTTTFPQIVRDLLAAGFDGYGVDFRRSTCTYYRPDGEAVALETAHAPARVAERFDAAMTGQAIREAQALVPGYTYKGFCTKVAGAGCAGYFVSLLGSRVLYDGRTGETYIEHFPGTQPAALP